MMNTKLALIVSVSAYALQINPVYASLLSSPPASILDTNIHTPARLVTHPQGVASQTCHNVQSSTPARQVAESGLLVNWDLNALLGNVPNESISDEQTKKTRGVAESGLLVDGNFQNQSSPVTPSRWREDDNSAGIPSFATLKDRLARNDNSFLTASVCFITDTGACSGNSFGGGGSEEYPTGGQPDWTLDNNKRCRDEGYAVTACSSVQQPSNRCPYNPDIFEKCVCRSDLKTCTKPQYGVGEACGGKYVSCQTDNPRACKEDGMGSNIPCSSVQTPDKICPYDGSYHDKCICRSDLKTCTVPEYGVGEACGGKYDSCKRDVDKACRDEGYTNTCPSGQKLKKSPRCPYDSSYGICCTEKCTNNSSTTCTGANTGDDGCGYSCYKCCDDTCPAYTSKTYKGAYAYTTGCGNRCYKCNCPSGTAPNYSGAATGSAECGTCYKCSNTCSRGQTSVSCSSKYERVWVASTECGNSCYECQYNSACDASRTSCSGNYECNYNSCGICTSCSYNYDCDVQSVSCTGSYVCSDTNSCGKCTSCRYNSDCDVSGLNCGVWGCSKQNTCGICLACGDSYWTSTQCGKNAAEASAKMSCSYGSLGTVSCGRYYWDGGDDWCCNARCYNN